LINNDNDEIRNVEKKTFKLHVISQVFNGLSVGIVLLQDIILKKSLGGTDFQIMLLSLFTSSAFLASIYGAEFINRSDNPPRLIIKMGIAAKFFLLLIPIFNNSVFFIVCISITAYLDSMMLSSWNIVFKHNYTDANRNKLYSYATSVSTSILLVSSTIFGVLLDNDNFIYRLIFPLSGIAGMFMYYNLSKMIGLSLVKYPKVEQSANNFSFKLFKDILILPVRNTKRIFKKNKPFFRFEIYFFLYGMAFMVILPAIPVYAVDVLNLGYTPISIARGLIFQSLLIIFMPLMGRLHGTGNPTKFCGYSFILLAFYPLIFMSAQFPVFANFFPDKIYIVYAAFVVFGIGMSAISISWTLGSIFYAPPFEVSNYQAVHITLTGLRGLFSPAIGYMVMKMFSVNYTFILSAFLFFTGGILMLLDTRLFYVRQNSIYKETVPRHSKDAAQL
jgi:hypothetical protein